MGITINGNPLDPKIARVLRAAMAIKREHGTAFTREGAQRTLDVTRDRRVDRQDFLALKKLIRARWFTSAFFRQCVQYIGAVPLGSAKIKYLGKGSYGRGVFEVKLAYETRKGMSVRIEVMKSSRLKLVFERTFMKSQQHAMPRLVKYKPMYIRSKLLERDGFKLRSVRKSEMLPAGAHRVLIKLAQKLPLKRSRP